MDFLKRHYEKLLLLLLLFAFTGSMMYVLDIVKQTGAIKDRDLEIPTREADQQKLLPTASDFQVADLLKSTGIKWNASTMRAKGNEGCSSDLTIPFEIALCPNPSCEKFLPRVDFKDGGQCYFCGEKLHKPAERKKSRFRVTDTDRDGDGIEDKDEQRYRLNPDDPHDALYDADHDGFSNLYEIRNGFSPRNRNNHPPFWHRLVLKKLDRPPLPVTFKSVNTNGDPKDKNKWDLQFNEVKKNGREETDFKHLGETMVLDGIEFKIADVELIKTTVAAKDGNSVQTRDESKILLTEVEGSRKETIQVGKVIYSLDVKAVLLDLGNLDRDGNPVELVVAPRQKFTLGVIGRKSSKNKKGTNTYMISEIDQKRKRVQLIDAARAAASKQNERDQWWVTTKGIIPPELRIQPVQKESVSAPASEGPTDNPEPEQPRGRRGGR